MFKWSNETYDKVKFFAIHVVPALEMFWGIIASVWNLPYGTQIGATIGGFGLCVAMCIGMSNAEYQREKQKQIESETEEDAVVK